jgi:hypothetical protein
LAACVGWFFAPTICLGLKFTAVDTQTITCLVVSAAVTFGSILLSLLRPDRRFIALKRHDWDACHAFADLAANPVLLAFFMRGCHCIRITVCAGTIAFAAP